MLKFNIIHLDISSSGGLSMSTRGILKIIGSIASLSMIMLLVSCGGGGGNNSTSNAENQAAVEVSGRIAAAFQLKEQLLPLPVFLLL